MLRKGLFHWRPFHQQIADERIKGMERRGYKKEKVRILNLLSRTYSTKASQISDEAKVRINLKSAIERLKKLSSDYMGYSNPKNFIGNVRYALGLKSGDTASSYGEFYIHFPNGVKSFSIRISNHNAVADTYHGRDSDFNLSISISLRNKKPNFKSNDDVVLDDVAYRGEMLDTLQNPLSDIIDGVIGYLQTGVYEDKTGVGILRKSPPGRQTSNQDVVDSFKADVGN